MFICKGYSSILFSMYQVFFCLQIIKQTKFYMLFTVFFLGSINSVKLGHMKKVDPAKKKNYASIKENVRPFRSVNILSNL